MPAKVPPFELYFEIVFLESYAQLKPTEQKAIDKAIRFLRTNPRHPSLNVHKAKQIKAKYPKGKSGGKSGVKPRLLTNSFLIK